MRFLVPGFFGNNCSSDFHIPSPVFQNTFIIIIIIINFFAAVYDGVRGGTVCRGFALQAGSSRVRFPILSLEFFIDILPAALWPRGSAHPLTEISTRNISWGDKAVGADNLITFMCRLY
jgi:hypothetical protein